MSKVSNFEVINSLFPSTPATWDARINTSSQELWNRSKLVINGDEFTGLRNEIFSQLVNRIALVKVRERLFSNPLSMFKQGAMPYGDTIQEIATDVLEAKTFNNGYSNQFETEEPKVRAAYHLVNRKQFYKVTVHDADLQYAFVNEYGLQSLINSIVGSLYSSNTIDEYVFTKKMITDVLDPSIFDYPVQDSQKLIVPHISTRRRSKEAIVHFLEDVKTTLRMMRFPNRKYNFAKQMNQVAADDITLVLRADVTSINEVNNLASAFNPEYLDLNIPIISVDDFGEGREDLIGVILTKKSLDIRNTKETVRIAENAQSLYTNYFFHIHQIYAVSPFENMLFIHEEKK